MKSSTKTVKDQRCHSRTGAVTIETILEKAQALAQSFAKTDTPQEDIDKIAQGALVFREFSQSSTSNVLFDWKEMFNLTGFSGPYVQYAVVRLGSIIQKADSIPEVAPDNDYDWQLEHKLLVEMSRYPAILRDAFETRQAYKLAFHVYDLAKEFNRYYERTTVLVDDNTTRACRLWLVEALRCHLKNCPGYIRHQSSR